MRTILFCFFMTLFCGCTNLDIYSKVGGQHLYLKNNEKELFWFDGIHCNDPNHRLFTDIKNKFEEYKPDLVLVEGGSNKEYKNKDEAILVGGEPGYASYLGFSEDIPVFDIEPPMKNQYGYLLQKYKKEDVLAMYIIRQMYQMQREVKDSEKIKINMDYFVGFVDKGKKEGFPITENIDLSYLNKVLFPHINKEINDKNWKEINVGDIIYFNTKKNIIHDIWKDTIDFRDNYCVELIEKMSKKYKKIFIMMGGDHIVNQKKRLEEIYSK